MRGTCMERQWRTVQLFISAQAAGVFEVEVDAATKNTRCNCPVWRKTASCKHAKFVSSRMDLNRGHYAILVPEHVAEEAAMRASENPESFREFVVKYAKVEVL